MMTNFRSKLLFAVLPLAACLLSIAFHAMGKPKLDDSTVMSQAEARPPGEPKLDPHLHDQLLSALNPIPISLPAPIRNPFWDRAGLATPHSQPPPTRTLSLNPSAGPGAKSGPLDADNQPLKPFPERYRDLQRRASQAKSEGRPVPPVTSIYSITELEIYGHTQNGGAWVYGKPEERAFTIPVNTHFIDGTFTGFDGDEAVFTTTGNRTVKLPLSRENP